MGIGARRDTGPGDVDRWCGMSAGVETSSLLDTTGAPPLFEARDIEVSFGGVRAVDSVSLTASSQSITGVVGPNGSGKTTFLNAVTGVVPAAGSLRIDGRPVTLGKPRLVRQAGILRAFQAPQTFIELSCIENVLLSSGDRHGCGIVGSWLDRLRMMRHERDRWAVAFEALRRVGLGELAEESAGLLTYGQQRLLEVARGIAADPKILMLDEPSAGLNGPETAQLSEILHRLRDDGITLIVIDHKIDFLDGLCDRLIVLELGRRLAEGTPQEVWADPRVVEAYLGAEHA